MFILKDGIGRLWVLLLVMTVISFGEVSIEVESIVCVGVHCLFFIIELYLSCPILYLYS